MGSRLIRGVIVTCCLSFVGCAEDQAPCDLWTASAIVSGRATDSSGRAIADLAVEVWIDPANGCDGTEDWALSQQVTTALDGSYSAEIDLGNSTGIRCVRVIATESGTSLEGEVEFVGGCDETGPPGELTIDLVIP
jgi:hypothetical protein